MKTEKITLATATDVVVFDSLVKVIRFDEGNAGGLPALIKVKSLSGGAYEVELKPGRQITLPEVTRGVVISNLSGNALTGKITIGAGSIEDNAVTGDVSIIDGGKSRTKSGLAFMGSVYKGATIGEYAHLQLWNPGWSARNLIITKFWISATTAENPYIRKYVIALPTIYGYPGSKKSSGAASVAELRTQSSPTVLPPTPTLWSAAIAAATTRDISISEPFVIEPDNGLVIVANSVNTELGATFEFYTEAI